MSFIVCYLRHSSRNHSDGREKKLSAIFSPTKTRFSVENLAEKAFTGYVYLREVCEKFKYKTPCCATELFKRFGRLNTNNAGNIRVWSKNHQSAL